MNRRYVPPRAYPQPRPLPSASPPIGLLGMIVIACLVVHSCYPTQTQPQPIDPVQIEAN